MNKRLVMRLLGAILLIESLAMAPSLVIALLYGDGDAAALAYTMAILVALGSPGCSSAPLARCPLCSPA